MDVVHMGALVVFENPRISVGDVLSSAERQQRLTVIQLSLQEPLVDIEMALEPTKFLANSANWTLKDDSELRQCMERIADSVLQQTTRLEAAERKLSLETDLLGVRLENCYNRIALAKNERLIEERILESPTESRARTSEASAVLKPLPTREERERHTISVIRSALTSGLQLIEKETQKEAGPATGSQEDSQVSRPPEVITKHEAPSPKSMDRPTPTPLIPSPSPLIRRPSVVEKAEDVSKPHVHPASGKLGDLKEIAQAAAAIRGRSLLTLHDEQPQLTKNLSVGDEGEENAGNALPHSRDQLDSKAETGSTHASVPVLERQRRPEKLPAPPQVAALIAQPPRDKVYTRPAPTQLHRGTAPSSRSKPVKSLFHDSSEEEEQRPAQNQPARRVEALLRVETEAVPLEEASVTEEAGGDQFDEMSRPVFKAMDADFSSRLDAAIKHGPVMRRGLPEPTQRPLSTPSISLRSDDATAPSAAPIAPKPAERKALSTVSNNEELGPASVASRIAQIGNRIPTAGRAPVRELENAAADGSSSPASRVSVDVVKERPKGPSARRAPSALNRASLPASSAAAPATDEVKSAASARPAATSSSQHVPPPQKTASVAEVPGDSTAHTVVPTRPTPSKVATLPTAGSGVSSVRGAGDTKTKKSIFDSSSSDEDALFGQASTTAHTSPRPQPPPTTTTTTSSGASRAPGRAHQVNKGAKQPETTVPKRERPSQAKKKSLFDSSDSDE